MRHQRMANVQLVDPLDCRYRFHVVVMQTVAIKGINELNIGHALVAHALFVGFKSAVAEMKALIVAAAKD